MLHVEMGNMLNKDVTTVSWLYEELQGTGAYCRLGKALTSNTSSEVHIILACVKPTMLWPNHSLAAFTTVQVHQMCGKCTDYGSVPCSSRLKG